MKTNVRNILGLILVFLSFDIVIADERRSAEQSAIGNLVSFMRTIQEINGSVPTNWNQIKQAMHPDTTDGQRLTDRLINPLQERYVFVTNKIAMLGYQTGNVVLIRFEPIEQVDDEIIREGRYAIATNETGFYSTWVSETNVQKMFAQAGVTNLPEPEPLIQPASATEVRKVSNYVNEAAQTSIPPVSPKQAVAPQAVEAAAPAVPEQPTNSPVALQAEPSSFVKPLVVALAVIFIFGLALLLCCRNKNGSS